MKTIVTHTSPDQDAISAAWLVKRFFPGFRDAEVKFVPAGETYRKQPPDSNSNVVHVDTGFGRFDHHQTSSREACAAKLVLDEVESKGFITGKVELEALRRIVAVVLAVDHAAEKLWPDPANDRWDFFLEPMLDGLKSHREVYPSEEVMRFGMEAMDGIFWGMQNKVIAGTILAQGLTFKSRWGKGIGVETTNDTVLSLGERLGYMIVVKKDPRRGNVRIYAHPGSTADLTPVYEQIHKLDPDSDWFLHASKRLLLNGSSKNPSMKPTILTLIKVIDIIKEV